MSNQFLDDEMTKAGPPAVERLGHCDFGLPLISHSGFVICHSRPWFEPFDLPSFVSPPLSWQTPWTGRLAGARILCEQNQVRFGVFRLFRDQIASFPLRKSGKSTVSRFLSFFRNARFAVLQYIILQDITLASRRWRRQRFPGFPGNFPRVYGWGGGKAKG